MTSGFVIINKQLIKKQVFYMLIHCLINILNIISIHEDLVALNIKDKNNKSRKKDELIQLA